MDYGRFLSRAWTILWEHKWLILLGVLVVLGSRGPGFSGGGTVQMPLRPGRFDFRLPEFDPDVWLPEFPRHLDLPVVLAVMAGLVIAVLAAVVGLALWAVSTIARGGLIAGVNTIDSGLVSTFGTAWNAGWRKGWRLIGIGVLPAIPTLILGILMVGAMIVFAATYLILGEPSVVVPGVGLAVMWGVAACVLLPIALVLSALQVFANRACMLEDLGVIPAYRRGLNVLFDHIGPALVLFLLQVVISVVLGAVLVIPRAILALCCILWPILLLIRATIASYFSTMWTLAWREWTGLGHVGDVTPSGRTASEL